jgi:gluconate 2-dehydrogenase alpha chain
MAITLKGTDVVVIGLGAAGGTAVLPLAQAGLEIVGLEAGPRFTAADYALDEIRQANWNWLGKWKVNNEVPTWRQTPTGVAASVASQGGAAILMNNGVGGTSIHYAAASWRYLPWQFQVRSHTIARYGAGAIPAGSTVADWPITYDDLEPYYEKVEYLHGESGVAGNLKGVKQPGGNPFEGPRNKPYPNPPLRTAGWSAMMGDAAKKLGYHPFPEATFIRSQPYKGMPACTYCALCSPNGCYIDAKGGTAVAGIPEAEATKHLQVQTGARATQINVDSNGRATGVTFVQGGLEYFQPAKVVIVSTYVYENVRLLLLSKAPTFPQGLSNNHGQVGKHYISQLLVILSGLFPGKALNTFFGTSGQSTTIDDLDGDNFDHTGLGFIGGGKFSFNTGKAAISAARLTPPSLPSWGSEWKAWIAKNANSVGTASGEGEALSYEDQFLDLDPSTKDPQGVPVVRVTYRVHETEVMLHQYMWNKADELLKAAGASQTWGSGFSLAPDKPLPVPVNSHAYGGTRMGDDPEQTVVNGFGVSHEIPNLLVLGASAFPTSAGSNPTKTVMAWSWRAADNLIKNWGAIAG